MFFVVARKILFLVRWIVDVSLELVYGLIYESDRHRSKRIPPIINPILLNSASALASKIRERKLTSVRVVQAYIDRINHVNDVINAVVDTRFDESLIEAKKVDELVKSSSKSYLERLAVEKPFLGVPFTAKDCFAVKGLSFTVGVHQRSFEKAGFDSAVVQRMRQAGAIPIAVTNVPELCLWMETSNWSVLLKNCKI